jgi:hypothetical protein
MLLLLRRLQVVQILRHLPDEGHHYRVDTVACCPVKPALKEPLSIWPDRDMCEARASLVAHAVAVRPITLAITAGDDEDQTKFALGVSYGMTGQAVLTHRPDVT